MTTAVEPSLQQVVANTWGLRYRIETEASLRFGALARRLEAFGAPRTLVELAERASRDETRHAAHCERFFRAVGGTQLTAVDRVIEYALRSWSEPTRLTYEVVAQCCVAETQSTATLVTLLEGVENPELKSALQELARDEVHHSRLGWAYLAWVRPRLDLAFLGPLLPGMVAGSAGPEIFKAPTAAADHPDLLRHGVVPQSLRRQVYVETLQSVVFPGFDTLGVDTAAARRWLNETLAAAPVAAS
ncbi:MAG: ferritin family protein [Myxococcaceae bacterium]